jgi:polyisoprenyl-teichoic acid--peptidoglycan teichoic acid transferase
VVLIVAGAAGSYWWFYAQVDAAQTDDTQVTGAIESSALTDAIGTPTGTDILILGSDNRTADAEEDRRSDTVILVHADPDADYVSMISFPRDLRVEIPDHGVDKLNAAYAYGGPALTVRTVEWLTGVDIDEYLEVDFAAFADITDSLGGVYLDIDRRYFNDDPQWELIKLSPGYQLLDGASALDYVRFRHDLNYDFGRMDRQQRFITAMREQTMGWDLPLRLPGIVDALFDNVETTLGATEILKLASWGVRLDGSRIKQITLVGNPVTRDGVSYVILPEGAIGEAIDKLMTAPAATGSEPDTAATNTSTTTDAATEATETTEVLFTTDPDKIENANMWQLYATSAPFVVRAPGYLPKGYAYVDRRPVDGGSYDIESGHDKPGLKVVYRLTREGEEKDQYLGIMETSWLDAPAAGTGQVVERNGVEYTIVGTNQRVDRIWWKVDDTLYWVSNTLSYYLSKKELMNVAESMIVIPSDGTGGRSEGGDGP